MNHELAFVSYRLFSSGELEVMLQEEGFQLHTMPSLPLESLFSTLLPDGTLPSTPGSGSGGYLDTILRIACKTFFPNAPYSIETKPGRNPDFTEYTLIVNDTPQLRFAAAYGFRNIQNIVRKIKLAQKQGKTRMDWDFVEVMACPSGCLNGGGQLKPDAEPMQDGLKLVKTSDMRAFVQKMEDVYRSVGRVRLPEDHQQIETLYQYAARKWNNNNLIAFRDWLGGVESEKARRMLHTQYHAVNDKQEPFSGAAPATNINW
jgi:iron only hydrogenase large subunit-like protein